MATLLRMPEVSANVESAVIVSWTKAPGDAVAAGECVAEIETDKAVIEFVAEAGGRLGRILVPAGQEARVGMPVAVLLAPGEQDADAEVVLGGTPAASAAQSAPVPEPASVPSAHADQPAAAAVSPDRPGTSASPASPASASVSPVGALTGRLFASPLARRLAAQAGLSLQGLAGSGPHGRIVKRDVQAALAQGHLVARVGTSAQAAAPETAGASAAAALAPGDVAVPHSAMRRMIARRLLESKTTIPHFYLRAECRMEALSALRRQINNVEGRRHVSLNDLIVKAVAAALVECPEMNVSWTDEALIRHAEVDLSVAVATSSGLITPVVRGVQGKSLSQVSAEIASLAARARDGKMQPWEYQGGSFTISNLGMYGTAEFAAIINPPQAAILAVGAVERRAAVSADDQVEVAPMMTVVLSVDHRVIDGAVAAQWLRAFEQVLENPLSALI